MWDEKGNLILMLSHYPWLVIPLAIVLSAGTACLLVPLALRLGWVDQPDARKVHDQATPPVGGLAISIALGLTLGLSPSPDFSSNSFFVVMMAAGLLLMLTGLIDDLRRLSAFLRFVIQVGACLLIIHFSGVRLDDFGQLFSANVLTLSWLAVPITVFAALGVINAFNMIDGMDGLSGSMFMVSAAGMASFATSAGRWDMFWFLTIAFSAVLGFMLLNARLPWNRRARIFLGDSGSLLLGFLLAWCFIRLGGGDHRVFMPMTAVWMFAVPLLDTSTLIWTRWRGGRSAFSADQNHLHHAFLRAGYTVEHTWLGITGLALVLAAIGIGFELSRLPEYFSFYSFMVVAFVYYFYMRRCWTSQRFLGRHFIHHDFTIEEVFP